ncbi:hypothetical protein ABW21_db0204798 [Orbilia brochopaga]|nr:hypothetical protein ABW21_db0204798 [Drechslerella brochopaga]
MKSEPSHATDGRDFNFADFTTTPDEFLQSLRGDAHNAATASMNAADSSYLLGFDNDYLVAPFEPGTDIFAFRGVARSPSPPESREQSPKSTNISGNSSESSPPQMPGGAGLDSLTMMADVEDDFPMLDGATDTVTFSLSSSNGFFGSNFTPLVPAPAHLPTSLGGIDKMPIDDPAKFFDFESAASSPLAVKIESGSSNGSQRQSSMPRFLPDNTLTSNTLNPQLSFSPPPYTQNRKKRRSEAPTLSPNSTDSIATFTFDTNGHPSPASSATNGVHHRKAKRHNSTSTSGEDEAAFMRSAGFHPAKAFGFSSMWSPVSFSGASPMGNLLGYVPTPHANNGEIAYTLTLRGDQQGGRINEKSRVETQIRVNLNLSPLPAGVSKLHLPTHTISKPKLLSKPPHQKNSDTLELYTSLICASAVEGNPELLQKVLRRAAEDPLQERVFGTKGSGEDAPEPTDTDKPLNGGEVRICAGCITRERKRAARKKIKKVEEEESWARDENKRIIVFNCSEILEWGPPEAQRKAEMEANDGEVVSMLDSNAEIWLPMRIACYCRHQSEKSGFRIILTIKDQNDNLIAQNITPPILITDDHKTNAPSQAALQQPVAAVASKGATSPSAALPIAPSGPVPVAPAPSNNALPYSASDTNLLSMNQTDQTIAKTSKGNHSRQNSRQSSVGMQSPPPYVAAAGPSAKKRKANPSSKARSELTMTKIDTSASSTAIPSAPPSAAPFTGQPFTPSTQNFPMTGTFEQPQSTTLENAPPNYFGFHNRNQSIDSLGGLQIFSAPTSAQASRVPSRVASPVQQFSVPQNQRPVFTPAQFAQVQSQLLNVANGQLSQTLMPFDITRIVPSEGPCQGGIEVTILGSGFQRSHTVFFGDKQSPRTEFWSDTTVVCLLPPSSTPGAVQVVMRFGAQLSITLPGRAGRFLYTDDTEQKMLALALQVINAKWSGKIEPPKDIAMRLLMDEKSPSSGGGSSSSGGSHRSHSAQSMQALQILQSPLTPIDLEAQLLKLLDIIDMDDSPYQAKLNLRNRQGQTMLHHACALGMSRFTAALLARGANPDAADKGGFTPTHFAVLKGHKELVRRLRINRADLNARSLSGVAPEDLTDAEDILAELSFARARSRRPSVSSVSSAPGRVMNGRRSRSGSDTLAVAMESWEPFGAHEDSEELSTDGDDRGNLDDEDLWIRPKRTISGRNLSKLAMRAEKPPSRSASMGNLVALSDASTAVPRLAQDDADAPPAAAAATAAALVAIREQLANLTLNLPNFHNFNLNLPNLNLQNFQQQMHLNLQNLQGQTARFNALLQGQPGQQGQREVADNNAAVPSAAAHPPNAEYKWWELFSPPNAPPAYEELFPEGSREDRSDGKMRVLGEAVARAMDAKAAAETTSIMVAQAAARRSVTESTSKTMSRTRTRRLTKEEEASLRAHHEKMKRIRGDRRLFFFWLPLCILLLVTMLTSWGKEAWIIMRTTYEVVCERMADAAEATAGAGRRIVEVG